MFTKILYGITALLVLFIFYFMELKIPKLEKELEHVHFEYKALGDSLEKAIANPKIITKVDTQIVERKIYVYVPEYIYSGDTTLIKVSFGDKYLKGIINQ